MAKMLSNNVSIKKSGSIQGYKAKKVKSKVYKPIASNQNDTSNIPSIFCYIIVICCIVSLLNMLCFQGGRAFYFSDLLTFLKDGNMPTIDMSWTKVITDARITADWGTFDFFRSFLNSILSLVSTSLYVVGGTAQLVVYIAYVCGFIIGV